MLYCQASTPLIVEADMTAQSVLDRRSVLALGASVLPGAVLAARLGARVAHGNGRARRGGCTRHHGIPWLEGSGDGRVAPGRTARRER